MDIEQRVKSLEQEMKILKNQVQKRYWTFKNKFSFITIRRSVQKMNRTTKSVLRRGARPDRRTAMGSRRRISSRTSPQG